ncbi:MlaE family lipid ABC transporter permease subunit [Asticcacaulis sp. AC402]|uniref:ABC transporter permease n=1 Tax=Asticcacaulis sp. AC402 TaxID=1282361 RepID=UPI0003C3D049|nr:MlaE family lipid ABC transporter permease subunit [Asticcacaulis sp. AC402]ESQ74775.1 hypothetical protein ABAC402_12785 [Asticcacaulis sp. AC402]
MPKAKQTSLRADFAVDAGEGGGAVLRPKGNWIVTHIEGLGERLRQALKPYETLTVDASQLEALDTAGAYVLRNALNERLQGEIFTGQENFARLYGIVGSHAVPISQYARENPEPTKLWLHPFYFGLVKLGKLATRFKTGFMAQSVFMGHIIAQLMMSVAKPGSLRWAALVNVMQRAGIEAIPIVLMTSIFIGGVLGFIGVLQLNQFGSGIFAIDMVAMFALREFAPLVTAVLLAGRSASAFAAEVGAMKMNQEIDAMRVMGIDPYEALIIPRLIALVFMSTFITFLSTLGMLFGGMLAIWSTLGAGPSTFLQRVQDYVPFYNFFVGIVRPPFFAATIAIVGCWQGMQVKDDVLSLGRQVTTAVVQSIFLVFMLDALFAILFNGFTM